MLEPREPTVMSWDEHSDGPSLFRSGQKAATGVRDPAFGHESPTSSHPETETPNQKTLHDNDDRREIVEGQQD